MIFKQEKENIKQVLAIADKWGYGNLIALLQRGWIEKLKKDGLDEETARDSVVGRTPYSIKMFKQFISFHKEIFNQL